MKIFMTTTSTISIIISIFFLSFTLFHEIGHYFSIWLFSKLERKEYEPIFMSMHFTFSNAFFELSPFAIRIISISGMVSQILFYTIFTLIELLIFRMVAFTILLFFLLFLCLSIKFFRKSNDLETFRNPQAFKNKLYNIAKKHKNDVLIKKSDIILIASFVLGCLGYSLFQYTN